MSILLAEVLFLRGDIPGSAGDISSGKNSLVILVLLTDEVSGAISPGSAGGYRSRETVLLGY